MHRVVALVKKELRSSFNSPVAFVVIFFHLVFTSVWFFFIQRFAARNVASMRDYFGIIPVLFIVLLPALTMRMWAEEHKMGTTEILVTLPYTVGELVFGKFLSAFLTLVLLLVLSTPVAFMILPLGNFDRGQILCEYIGVLLLGSAGISVGLFVSGISRNQITAFLAGAAVLLFLTLIGQLVVVFEVPVLLTEIVHAVSFAQHLDGFSRGVIDTRDVAYFLVLTVLFLYLNAGTLTFRTW